MQEQGKYQESLQCFQKIIDSNPDFIPGWIYKGISLEKLGRYEEAIDCYEQAIELHPDASDLWYNKAVTLCKIKRYPDALRCFERVLELEPDHSLARTAQTLILATPPVYDPMPKLTELERDKEGREEVKLYLAKEAHNYLSNNEYSSTETERS